MNAAEQFRGAIRAAGLTPPGTIEAGRFHRFPGFGKRNGNTAGWCKLFPDERGGIFGDFSTGFVESWQAKDARPLTLAERDGFRQYVAQARAEAATERRKDQAVAAARAATILKTATQAPDGHPYLVAKGVRSHGLRLDNGALVVPMRDSAGELWNVQRIGPDGAKRFLSSGRVTDCYFAIGQPNETLCIAEGYATAASIHEATGHAVAVAFNAGNLNPVAVALRAKLPDVHIIICADDDYRTAGNPGLTKATEAARAVGGVVAVPDFGTNRPDGATDFNDLARHAGADAVKHALASARPPDIAEPQPARGNATAGDSGGPEWLEPLAIRAQSFPVPIFDAAALLPDALRDWVMDEAERMPCAPDFVAAATVVALGAAIGARCAIKPKARDSWLVVPNLWGGVVALPSAKKSPAIAAAMRPLDRLAAKAHEAHRIDLDEFETDRLVADARRDAIKEAIKKAAAKPDGNPEAHADELRRHNADAPEAPKLRRYSTNDSTVEKLGELLRDNPTGILVLRDELVGLLASWEREGREGDRAFYLEGWNGTAGFNTDRIGRGSINIPNLCIAVFGGIQPDKLTGYLEQAADALGNDGMLQRLQVLVYPDPRTWEWRDRSPNAKARDDVFQIFEMLSDFDPVAWGALAPDAVSRFPHFRFDEGAQQVFIEWTTELHRARIPSEQADGHPLIAQHLAKYDKLFAGLALVLHLADCAATGKRGPVSEQAAIRAAAWCEYLEAHARRCYGLLADEGLRAAQALADRLRGGALADGFTAFDVKRKGWRYLTTDKAVGAALEWVEADGWVIGIPTTPDPAGGRRTVRYRINPKIRKEAGEAAVKTEETLVSAVNAVPHLGAFAETKRVANG